MADAGDTRFFAVLDEMTRTTRVVIDRPKERPHPRAPHAIYPVDYGHLPGTTGGDGEGIDVFVGSASGDGLVAVALTADPEKRDAEIKLLLDCTAAEMHAISDFLTHDLGIGACMIARPGIEG